jgi:hypothetical protein
MKLRRNQVTNWLDTENKAALNSALSFMICDI